MKYVRVNFSLHSTSESGIKKPHFPFSNIEQNLVNVVKKMPPGPLHETNTGIPRFTLVMWGHIKKQQKVKTA